jgi:hypothetical protein
VDGVDMGTSAQIGIFGPTNQENAVGATRSIFLKSQNERIQRPKFGPKREKRKAGDNDPAPPREDGHPSNFLPHASLPHSSCLTKGFV